MVKVGGWFLQKVFRKRPTLAKMACGASGWLELLVDETCVSGGIPPFSWGRTLPEQMKVPERSKT